MTQQAADQPPWDEWEPARLHGRLGDYHIIDVREPEEFAGPLGHLPDAQLIPLATLPAHVDTLPTDVPLLLVCKVGMRSASACRFLAARGFTRLTNLSGGMIAWRTFEAANKNKG